MLAYHSVERDVLNVLNEIWNVYKKIKNTERNTN